MDGAAVLFELFVLFEQGAAGIVEAKNKNKCGKCILQFVH